MGMPVRMSATAVAMANVCGLFLVVCHMYLNGNIDGYLLYLPQHCVGMDAKCLVHNRCCYQRTLNLLQTCVLVRL